MDSTFINLYRSGVVMARPRAGQVASSSSSSSHGNGTAVSHSQLKPPTPELPDPLTESSSTATPMPTLNLHLRQRAATTAVPLPPKDAFILETPTSNRIPHLTVGPAVGESRSAVPNRRPNKRPFPAVDSLAEGSRFAVPIQRPRKEPPPMDAPPAGPSSPRAMASRFISSSPLPASSSPLPASPSLKRSLPFNQSQRALALTLVRCRPENVPTAGYAQRLQRNVKTINSRNINEERRYVDSAEFWKDQSERFHAEKKALEDIVHRREEELRLLKMAQNGETTDDDFPENWNEETTFISANDEHQLRMSGYVFRLQRERSNLDKINGLLSDPNRIEDALRQVNCLLVLLSDALSDCCSPLELYIPKKPWQDSRSFTNLRKVTYQVNLGFQSCFTTLHEICARSIPSRGKRGHIIYGMVLFVGNAIKLLHTLCRRQVEHQKLVDHQKLGEQEVYAVNKCLTNTIVSIILGLDWEVGEQAHAELLEGILFAVLEHTGSLLSMALFGGDIPARKKRKSKDKTKTPPVDTTNVESLCMVQILYAALGGAKKQDLVTRVLEGGKGAELCQKGKRYIQSTLFKYTYGKERMESLRSHVLPAEEIELPEVEIGDTEKEYGHEWLICMATKIVGWDLVLPPE